MPICWQMPHESWQLMAAILITPSIVVANSRQAGASSWQWLQPVPWYASPRKRHDVNNVVRQSDIHQLAKIIELCRCHV